MTSSPLIRPARDSDAPSLIEIVKQVFAQYEGCVFDLEELPDLNTFATSAASRGGAAFVAEIDGQVIGCVAIEPCAQGFELHRLYVLPAQWGLGAGHALMAAAEHEAESSGAPFIELWSDLKFERAHRFYERRGYVKSGAQRELHDKSNTVEYYFRRPFDTAPDITIDTTLGTLWSAK